jgi:hypothetical protein
MIILSNKLLLIIFFLFSIFALGSAIGVIVSVKMFKNVKKSFLDKLRNSDIIIAHLENIRSILWNIQKQLSSKENSAISKSITETLRTSELAENRDSLAAEIARSYPGEKSLDSGKKICLEYNNAIRDNSLKLAFQNHYPEIVFFTVKNYLVRSYKPHDPPEPQFVSNIAGEYLAVPSRNRSWYVFPKFDIKIESSFFEAGAMKDVFLCVNYSSSISKQINKIIRPAIFERKSVNEWIFIKQGELEIE